MEHSIILLEENSSLSNFQNMVQELTHSTILNLLCLKNKIGPTDLSADSTPYLNFYVA
jgi:hypothetical protein